MPEEGDRVAIPMHTPPAGGTEVEAKYAVPDGATFAKLESLEALGEFHLGPAREERVTDRYIDTPERDLLRGGYACRRRAGDGGGPELVTVKGLGGARGALHRRAEHEVRVPPGSPPGQWPAGPGTDLVRRLAGDRALVDLFTVTQHRIVRDVELEGRRVAEWSLDRVDYGAPGGRIDQELEIQLAPAGDGADLSTLARLLRPFRLRPQPLSKFQRALALLDGGEPGAVRPPKVRKPRSRPGAGPAARPAEPTAAATRPRRGKQVVMLPADPMAEAGREILRFHFDKMLAHEAGTIAGTDPEELHDMRVATRRQRAALRIVRPHFRRKAIRPVLDGLRELAGCLGEVRDLDVLLEAARAHQSTLDAAEARAFQGLIDAWTRRDEAARQRMLRYLGEKAYADFKQRYRSFLDTPGAGARTPGPGESPRPSLVAHVLRSEVWAHYGRVCAFESVLPDAPVETLHALRIEGKRLRYLLEFFREVLHPCAADAIEAMVALQDHLGAVQDGVVTIGLIRGFLSGPEATAVPGAAPAAGRYLEARHARIEELRRTLDRPWKQVSGPRFRSSLSRAVAAL